MFIDFIKQYFRSTFVAGLFQGKPPAPGRGALSLLPSVLFSREMSILGVRCYKLIRKQEFCISSCFTPSGKTVGRIWTLCLGEGNGAETVGPELEINDTGLVSPK